MSRYTQDQSFNIKGPGLPESGAVAIGPAELEAAFQAGRKEGRIESASRVSFMAQQGWTPTDVGHYMGAYVTSANRKSPQSERE